MKRIIVVAVAALALLPASVFAAECKAVTEYRVGYVAYRARPLEQTLQRIFRGTPYRGMVEGGVSAAPTRIQKIAGPLSHTLDKLAAHYGMHWRQEGCLLRFTDKQASRAVRVPAASPIRTVITAVTPTRTQESVVRPAPTSWVLQADAPIHKQFADWAHYAGWKFEWRLEKSWLVPAATQFTGTFDEALSEAVEALHAQGKPVRLIIWEGNRFAEIVDVDAK